MVTSRQSEPARLLPGEKVEIVSDRAPGFVLRYARTIHVIQPLPPVKPQRTGLPRPYNPRTDAVRTGTPLNCTGELGFAATVAVLKVNEAIVAGKRLEFSSDEFKV